jgi:hypothetical protein
MEMHIQRHDNHEKGNLTPDGREHARQVALEKVRTYLDKDPRTHFMIVASNQVLDDDMPEIGGMRAIETAEEITKAIKETLAERGLSEDQLFGSDSIPIADSSVLQEAKIFHKPEDSDQSFMGYLRTKEGKPWNLYYQDVEKDMREKMHAESPIDLAKRMDYIIKTTEMIGASFHKNEEKKDTPLVVWMVGHGGGLDAYLHHFANVPVEEVGFDVSGGFSIRTNEKGDGLIAEVKGKEYSIDETKESNFSKGEEIAPDEEDK